MKLATSCSAAAVAAAAAVPCAAAAAAAAQVSGAGYSECALKGLANKPKKGDALMFYRCVRVCVCVSQGMTVWRIHCQALGTQGVTHTAD